MHWIDLAAQRSREFSADPEPFRARNADIAANYGKWGSGVALAKKYGISVQRVQQIYKREAEKNGY